MTTVKQIQNRILNAKRDLNKVIFNITSGEKNKDKIGLRRLNQKKSYLERDIRKLERELISTKQELMQKNKVNPF